VQIRRPDRGTDMWDRPFVSKKWLTIFKENSLILQERVAKCANP